MAAVFITHFKYYSAFPGNGAIYGDRIRLYPENLRSLPSLPLGSTGGFAELDT
jgi:hypothetical protein